MGNVLESHSKYKSLVSMVKLDKYYNYIVDDLVKKTIIEGGFIKFPWEGQFIGTDYISVNFVLGEISSGYLNYMEDRYGSASQDSLTVLVKYAQQLEIENG